MRKSDVVGRRAITVGALALAALVGVGCASRGEDKAFNVRATLSGAQEVPPNAATGTGELRASFDRKTSALRWTVTYSGLTGPLTGAHFHGPAGVGQNGPVTIGFGNQLASPITGEATLTASQAADLAAGRWYVNLHTRAHPGGEIRAQVTR